MRRNWTGAVRLLARLFGQTGASGPVAELMALFARALNDLGRHLLARFDGRFAALVEAAGASAQHLTLYLLWNRGQ